MKKNGKLYAFLGACFVVGLVLGTVEKNKMKSFIGSSNLTLENYMNRLKEFDMSDQKEATKMFLDLLSSGIIAKEAFSIVQQECLEVGEFYYD